MDYYAYHISAINNEVTPCAFSVTANQLQRCNRELVQIQ